MGGTPCDKKGTSKWVLSFDLDGWQGLDGSHQWEVAEVLLCLRKKKRLCSYPFCLMSFMFPFFLQVTMSQNKIVTCFHEYVMKRYKVL